MEFYPLSFEIDADTRSIQTQLQGKKMPLTDARVNIRGVMCRQHGEVKSFKAPEFTLELYQGGYRLSWPDEVTQDLEVILEAQGNGGITTRANMYLRLPNVAVEPEIVRPGLAMSPHEQAQALIDAGAPHSVAIRVVADKRGESVVPELEKFYAKELTDGE